MISREDIIEELRAAEAGATEKIRACNEKISSEQFLRGTITDGALATAARNSIDGEISKQKRIIAQLEKESKWRKDVLVKYK